MNTDNIEVANEKTRDRNLLFSCQDLLSVCSSYDKTLDRTDMYNKHNNNEESYIEQKKGTNK